MSIKNKKIFTVIALIICVVVARIVWRIASDKKGLSQENGPVPVEAVQSEFKTIEETISMSGDIRGLNEAKVYSRVGGRLMRKVRDVGEMVKKGEVVAFVDRDEPALKFAPAEITSPLPGVITKYFLDIGQNVTPQVPVLEVAEINSVKALVQVTEKELNRVKTGQTVRFKCDAYPDKVFHGRVAKISESLDINSRTSEVEIHSENSDFKLKPGMFARVEIVLKKKTSVVIPREALIQQDNKYFIFVLKNSKAVKVPVEAGIIRENEIEILKGLKPRDTVVTVGWHNLTDGQAVEVVNSIE